MIVDPLVGRSVNLRTQPEVRRPDVELQPFDVCPVSRLVEGGPMGTLEPQDSSSLRVVPQRASRAQTSGQLFAVALLMNDALVL